MIKLISKSEDYLVPLMDAKAHIRVDASFDDAYVYRLIRQAQDYAEEYCRRALTVNTYEYSPDCDQELKDLQEAFSDMSDRIVIREGIITEIVSLNTYDVAGAATLLTLSDYAFLNYPQYSLILKKDGKDVSRGTRTYEDLIVQFKAGYTEETLPLGLRGGILQLIGFYYECREGMVEGGKEPDHSITDILRKYRYEVI